MKTTRTLIATPAILGWAALIANLHPGFELDAAARVLAVALAITGSVILTLDIISRPVREVYEMGHAAGKREAKIEAAASASRNVLPMRRHQKPQKTSRLG